MSPDTISRTRQHASQHALPRVALTGASGYVGSCVARSLEAQGMTVWRLQRSGAGKGVRRFTLGEPVDPALFRDTDAVVHCAYDFGAVRWHDISRTNVDGSLELFRAAKQAGVGTLLFISSMSAFDGCRSMYGRAKLAVEREGAALGVVAIRPGLVYGAGEGGMVGALNKLLKLPLVTPLVGSGDQMLYLVHEADLGTLLGALCRGGGPVGARPIIAAHPQPLQLREILVRLAARHGKRLHFLPVPWQLEWLALRTAEWCGVHMRLRSDSLMSLLNQDPAPDFAAPIPCSFRAFTP